MMEVEGMRLCWVIIQCSIRLWSARIVPGERDMLVSCDYELVPRAAVYVCLWEGDGR